MPRLFLYALIFSFGLCLPAEAAKLYDKDYIGETTVYRAKFEDTLVHLARDNNLGFVEMRAANPNVDPWIPGAGAKIVMPTQHLLPDAPREGIVINLPDMRLYYFEKPGEAPVTYSIGIGREGLNTPLGKTSVMRKVVGPTWTPTPRMRKEKPELPAVVPPGPENPMGTHAIYLGFPQIAIHGTDKPYGIGRRVSSGCIRLYPEGIKDLYPRVPVGTKVTVVDQPVKVGWIDNKMYIEVQPTQDQSFAIEENGVLKDYQITTEDMKRITDKAGQYAMQIDWQTVRQAVREHKGYPIPILDTKKKPGERVYDDLQALLDEAGATPEDIQLSEARAVNEPLPVKEDERVITDGGSSAPAATQAQTEGQGRERRVIRNFNFNN